MIRQVYQNFQKAAERFLDLFPSHRKAKEDLKYQLKEREAREKAEGLIFSLEEYNQTQEGERRDNESLVSQLVQLQGETNLRKIIMQQRRAMSEQARTMTKQERVNAHQRKRIYDLTEAVPNAIEATVRLIGEGHAYALLSSDGGVKSISPEACELLGIRANQAIGKSYIEFLAIQSQAEDAPATLRRSREPLDLGTILINNKKEPRKVNIQAIPIYVGKYSFGYILSLDKRWTQFMKERIRNTLAYTARFLRRETEGELIPENS